MTTYSPTQTDKPITIKLEVHIDPRDLELIMTQIDFGYRDKDPGVREIQRMVKYAIGDAGVRHLLFKARSQQGRAEREAESTDPGARKHQSELRLWCRGLIDKAFKQRKPRASATQEGASLLDVL